MGFLYNVKAFKNDIQITDEINFISTLFVLPGEFCILMWSLLTSTTHSTSVSQHTPDK